MPGPGRTLDPRLPVLVGLGAVHDGAPAEDLMERAARAAADDAGAPELLAFAVVFPPPQRLSRKVDFVKVLNVRVDTGTRLIRANLPAIEIGALCVGAHLG